MQALVGCDAADSNQRGSQNSKETNLNAIDSRGVSLLLDAVGSRDIARVRALLEGGADPDAKGVARSPLVTAITELDAKNRRLVCNVEMVRLLLDHGADPNRRDPSVDTRPLNKALELGELGCAALLRDRGASIDGLDPGGRTLLDSAVAGAVLRKDMSIIDVPLHWGVDPNVRSTIGSTALTTAVWLNSADAVRILLARGVDPCIPDSRSEDRIPLNIARNLKSSAEVVELLEQATNCSSPK
jgi:ankyrin repeat protein